MEKEFVPYEQALALKELGFNEPCIKGFFEKEPIYTVVTTPVDFNNKKQLGELISVPTFSQAFRWFREKYNIVGSVKNLNTHTTKHEFYAEIVEPITVSSYSIYDTYEQAELECLVKLIEIVKS
jgi:hypothetical protein